jgi:hypothetical protein
MNSNATLILAITTLITTIIPLTACEQEPLPDLIIDSVTCQLNTDTASPYRELVYTVTIRNIGDAPASGRLYVSVTSSNEGLRENHYSAKWVKSTEPPIEPGEVFENEIFHHIIDDAATVGFMVNPELDLPQYGDRIEESNYKNNTYELEIPEDIPVYIPPEREEDEHSGCGA